MVVGSTGTGHEKLSPDYPYSYPDSRDTGWTKLPSPHRQKDGSLPDPEFSDWLIVKIRQGIFNPRPHELTMGTVADLLKTAKGIFPVIEEIFPAGKVGQFPERGYPVIQIIRLHYSDITER